MATLTLNYDERNIIAVKAVQYIQSLGVFNKEEGLPRTTSSFKKSIQEMEAGKTHRLQNTENPLAEILQ